MCKEPILGYNTNMRNTSAYNDHLYLLERRLNSPLSTPGPSRLLFPDYCVSSCAAWRSAVSSPGTRTTRTCAASRRCASSGAAAGCAFAPRCSRTGHIWRVWLRRAWPCATRVLVSWSCRSRICCTWRAFRLCARADGRAGCASDWRRSRIGGIYRVFHLKEMQMLW